MLYLSYRASLVTGRRVNQCRRTRLILSRSPNECPTKHGLRGTSDILVSTSLSHYLSSDTCHPLHCVTFLC
ncbi:unnamed protein product [Hymenolepis diminuta]|uniref:Uncharacterized protein n=1 Tax=Hymenolepis diminuta TaxID=6216 RepID=A0A564Y5D1_HYMDI|nr:unnamed protein product [Hymenolepis diminuta]